MKGPQNKDGPWKINVPLFREEIWRRLHKEVEIMPQDFYPEDVGYLITNIQKGVLECFYRILL